MQIVINEEGCFVCPNKRRHSTHHTIPLHLNPKNNVLVPVCKECHDKINNVDMGAVSSYLYKIVRDAEKNMEKIEDIRKMIKEYRSRGGKVDGKL